MHRPARLCSFVYVIVLTVILVLLLIILLIGQKSFVVHVANANVLLYLVECVMIWLTLDMLGMNFPTWPTIPRNLGLSVGSGISVMAYIRSLLGLILVWLILTLLKFSFKLASLARLKRASRHSLYSFTVDLYINMSSVTTLTPRRPYTILFISWIYL